MYRILINTKLFKAPTRLLEIIQRNSRTRSDLCFELPSSSPRLFVPPPESVHANHPLQTDSGFHYVNSFPIKMLSKQIFREQQKEEVASGLKRGKPFCLKAASAEHVGEDGGVCPCSPYAQGLSLTSTVNVCFVLCQQGDLCERSVRCALVFFPSWALIRCTYACVFATISI